MWEWREERGRWRLDDSGSWNWDEPSLLQRVGAAPFGAAAPHGPATGRLQPPGPPPVPPPPPPPGPWVPPEAWRRGPSSPGRPVPQDGTWPADAVPSPADLLLAEPVPAGPIPAEETPIFAAVAEDHERDEVTGGQRLRPSRHGVPEPGHPGADDRGEYRTAPWIPDPSPGSGPFAMPLARHARDDAARADAARLDGRHALRR